MQQGLWLIAGVLAGVDPALLSGLCYVESNHQKTAYVHNDGGSPSIGICQVKLGTARLVGFKGTAAELQEPFTNALYAGLYLKKQQRRYRDDDKAISAYNAGRAISSNARYVQKVKAARGVSWTKLRKTLHANVASGVNCARSQPSPTSIAPLVKMK